MIYLLFVLLTTSFIVDLFIRKFDILRPGTWVYMGFLLSSFVGLLNFEAWGDITLTTVLVIWCSVLIFNLVSYAGELIYIPFLSKVTNIDKHFPLSIVLFMNVLMVLAAILYFRFMYTNSILGGNPGGFNQFFSYARLAEQNGIANDPSTILSLLMSVSFSFAFVQTFIVVKDVVYVGINKIRVFDLVTVFFYFVQTLLTGGRTRMMYYILFIIVVGLIMFRNREGWTRRSINIGIKYIFFGFFLVILTFWIVEKTVRGSVYGNTYSLWYQFSKYIASPIYALDSFIQNPSYMTRFVETETMYPILSMLRRIGFPTMFNNNALEFVSYANGSEQIITNIYTAFRRYIHDFKLIGLLILISFQSLLYSSLYTTIKAYKIENTSLLLYGIVVYPAAFYFIEERFMNDLFTLSMIFQYIIILAFVVLLKYFGIYRMNLKHNGKDK